MSVQKRKQSCLIRQRRYTKGTTSRPRQCSQAVRWRLSSRAYARNGVSACLNLASLNLGAANDRAVRESIDLHGLLGKPVEELPT